MNVVTKSSKAAQFNDEALRVIQEHLQRLRSTLTYEAALRLPAARGEDIVVAGKEVQLMIFRQAIGESSQGQALVTVQLARYGLGGVSTYLAEKGVVFSPTAAPRDATDEEMTKTGG
jgi:hypothetical protein